MTVFLKIEVYREPFHKTTKGEDKFVSELLVLILTSFANLQKWADFYFFNVQNLKFIDFCKIAEI